MKPSERVALNTIILYLRMIVTMFIAFYSTRLILSALGKSDFGLYQLVAGVITMLSFLNAAMTTSTQRFFSFHKSNQDRFFKQKIFKNSLTLHILVALVLFLFIKIAGVFLFNDFLNIEPSKIEIAKFIYDLMNVSVVLTVVSVPFNALLVAHENMLWVAMVSIIEAILKLVIAFILLGLEDNRLSSYAILMALVTLMSLIFNALYCIHKYEETSFSKLYKIDNVIFKELFSFAGWNLFGAICGMARTQGLSVVLNLFFGTVINAAYGIANQVSSQVNFLSTTMLRSLNPQIMKSEGDGDRERMLRLAMMASKFGFFLLTLLAIPVLFEAETLLTFWLKDVPEYTIIFTKLIILSVIFNQLTIGLQSAIQATGEIKVYQIVVGGLIIMNVPIAYLFLKLGYQPYVAFIILCVIELVACTLRLYFLKKFAGLSISMYVKSVFKLELFPVLINVVCCFIFVSFVEIPFRFIFTIIFSCLIYILCIYLFGLSKSERNMINKSYHKIIYKIPFFKFNKNEL